MRVYIYRVFLYNFLYMQKDLMLKLPHKKLINSQDHVIMPSNFKKNVCCEITPPIPCLRCGRGGGFSPTPPHPLLSRQQTTTCVAPKHISRDVRYISCRGGQVRIKKGRINFTHERQSESRTGICPVWLRLFSAYFLRTTGTILTRVTVLIECGGKPPGTCI